MFKGELIPFQKKAHDMIVSRKKVLLALPMGTGKTITSLASIESLMENGYIGEPGIILAGSSLLYQWESEIDKWTDSRSMVVSGSPKKRQQMYEEFYNWEETGIDYLILTYDSLRIDKRFVGSLPRGFVIADECVALKGFRSKRSKAAKELFRTTSVKIGLSGSPVENGKPEEIFSIMQFIDPSVLGRFDLFDSSYIQRNQFGGVERYRNLQHLHKRMKTAMFHRTFESPDIAQSLPEQIIKDPVPVHLTGKSLKTMRAINDDILDRLDELRDSRGLSSMFDPSAHYGETETANKSDDDVLRGLVMSRIVAARMFCDHPQLLRDSALEYQAGNGKGSAYAASLLDRGLLDIESSPKLEAAMAVLETMLSDPRSKVVVFSSFVGMLNILAEECRDRFKAESVTYHGQLSSEEREIRKSAFKADPNVRLFISSDAGGMGVDLPEANYLMNYDLPWQAGMLAQRNARPRRVSSNWACVVIESPLVVGSVESWQADMLRFKSAVSSAILSGDGLTESGDLITEVDSLTKHLSIDNIG